MYDTEKNSICIKIPPIKLRIGLEWKQTPIMQIRCELINILINVVGFIKKIGIRLPRILNIFLMRFLEKEIEYQLLNLYPSDQLIIK